MEDFSALSGDFLFERKKLSESLKRLERVLAAPEVSGRLPGSTLLALQSEVDRLTAGIFRLEALAKNLSAQAQVDRYEDSFPILQELCDLAKRSGQAFGRGLTAVPSGHGVRADRYRMQKLRPVLRDMLETFIEFSIETPKERRLRGKREAAHLQVSMRRQDEGSVLSIVADGSGVAPPLTEEHGERLAEIGVRATFQGRPGKWSCWVLHIPHYGPVMNCFSIVMDGFHAYVPCGAVTAQHASAPAPDAVDPVPLVMFDKNLRPTAVPRDGEGVPGRPCLEVAAGARRVLLLLDEVPRKEEVFMKPVPESLSGHGRFLGAVIDGGGSRLCSVLNPTYLVYGSEP